MIHAETMQVIEAIFSKIYHSDGETAVVSSTILGGLGLGALGLGTGGLGAAVLLGGLGFLGTGKITDEIHKQVYLPLARLKDAYDLYQEGIEIANGKKLPINLIYQLIQPIQQHMFDRRGVFCTKYDPTYEKHVHELIEYMSEKGHHDALKSLLLLGAHQDDIPAEIVDEIVGNRALRIAADQKETLEQERNNKNSLFHNFQNKDLINAMVDHNAQEEARESIKNATPKINPVV